jgi:hypothetical protein
MLGNVGKCWEHVKGSAIQTDSCSMLLLGCVPGATWCDIFFLSPYGHLWPYGAVMTPLAEDGLDQPNDHPDGALKPLSVMAYGNLIAKHT